LMDALRDILVETAEISVKFVGKALELKLFDPEGGKLPTPEFLNTYLVGLLPWVTSVDEIPF